MSTAENRPEVFRRSASRWVFVAPLLPVSGLTCFSFVDNQSNDRLISELSALIDSPTNRFPYQSFHSDLYPTTKRAPEHPGDPGGVTSQAELRPGTIAGTDWQGSEGKKNEGLVMPERRKGSKPGGGFKGEVKFEKGKNREGITTCVNFYRGFGWPSPADKCRTA